MYHRICILLLILLILPGAVLAQDDPDLTAEQQEMLRTVNRAFLLFHEQQSYMVRTTELVVQEVIPAEHPEQMFIIRIDQAGEGSAIRGTETRSPASRQMVTQQITVELAHTDGQPQTTMIETMVVDGVLYARVIGDLLVAGGWVNLSENPNALPGMENLDVEAALDVAQTTIPQSGISSRHIRSIIQLADSRLETRNVEVYEVVWDIAALYADEMLPPVFSPEATGFDAQALTDAMINQGVLVQRFWIGVEDNMVYQVRTEFDLDVRLSAAVTGTIAVDLMQMMTATAVFSDYNAPLTIQPPLIGQGGMPPTAFPE